MKLKFLFFVFLFFIFWINSFATHIVGGDITVKWVSGNDFEVTLTFYRDCSSGTFAYPDPVHMGAYDRLNNAEQLLFDVNLSLPTDTLPLGDNCNQPNLCVEKGIYQTIITLPDNSNGYYIMNDACCRNVSIKNIINPSNTGIIFYAEIPDPVLHNSTPVFNSFPNAFMCANQSNIRNFLATDVNGDSLVYSIVTPIAGSGSGVINQPPPSSPGTYSLVVWKPPFNLANILGGSPAASIDFNTGILTANPVTLGLYVFSVRVEEYRNGIKIGEIRLDIQCPVLVCKTDIVPVFVPPTPLTVTSYTVVTGDSLCFPVKITDANLDTVMLTVSSEIFNGSINMPKATFLSAKGKENVQSEFCIYADCNNISENPYHLTFEGQDTLGFGVNKIFYDFDIYITTPKVTEVFPNVFTPNGDTKNDYFATNIINYPEHNYCVDEFNIKIYNRWGNLVFESDDFLFRWDGKKKGKEMDDGVYYYVLTSKFQETYAQEKGFVHLLR